MGKFDRLLDKGLEKLSEKLISDGDTPEEVEELGGLIEGLNFPALLGLLGTSKTSSGQLGEDLLNDAAADVESAAPAPGVSADDVKRLLTGVFRHQGKPSDVSLPGLGDGDLRDKVFDKGVEALAKRSGIPITPAQAKKIANLLATGEFFRDIGSATAAILFTVRGLPVALVRDVPRFPLALIRLPLAVTRDLSGTAFSVPAVFSDLRDGKLDDPPVVLKHTLTALYSSASIGSISEMIRTLIQKDNETVRLAIIIYARSNGIPLEEEDLDALRDSVFNTDDPDLGPVLIQAVERFDTNFDRDSLKRVLTRLV
jgi:hypothetical protein